MRAINNPKLAGKLLNNIGKTLILMGVLFSFQVGKAQPSKNFQDDYKLHIQKAQSVPVIDGNLSEEDWSRAEVAQDFPGRPGCAIKVPGQYRGEGGQLAREWKILRATAGRYETG